MDRPLETKADLIQAWSGVANFVLLVVIAFAALIRFAWIDKSLANLEAEKTRAEVEAATTPILAIEPTLVVGPELGHQFNAVKLHVRAKNIGNGRLQLGTVSVQVSQSLLPQELADPLVTASKRGYNDEYQPTIESTKIVPISRYDLNWVAIADTKRKYRLDSSLLPNQEAQFYVDYVLEPGAKPHLIRFEVTLAPPNDVDWQSKTSDLVAPFGPMPVGFGEAIMNPSKVTLHTVSDPVGKGKDVTRETSVTDTLRLVRIE
jgi:hypothetical protein